MGGGALTGPDFPEDGGIFRWRVEGCGPRHNLF